MYPLIRRPTTAIVVAKPPIQRIKVEAASPSAFDRLLNWHGDFSQDWLKLFSQAFQDGMPTMLPLLPAVLNLEGHPYTLNRHYPFEPLFRANVPRKSVWKCARQLGKSRSVGARMVIMAALRAHYRALYVAPLYEQTLKFSNDYVAPFIEDSPIRALLRIDKRSGSVLRRAFRNRAVLYFSYAFLNSDRIRSTSVKMVIIDEAQDFEREFIPNVNETMSAFPEESTSIYTGTSKTRETTLEDFWSQSSQAEWVTRCEACNYDNIASIDHHLLQMIGPWEGVSPSRPGTICARCRRPVFPGNPRLARWEHRRPELAFSFAGQHIPQVIMPGHFESEEAWRDLHRKQKGLLGYTKAKFMNEVLGEASDESLRLLTKTDLEKAAHLHPNTEEEALRVAAQYHMRVLTTDWGGGGEDRVSLTTPAILGFIDGRVDVIHAKKLPNPEDHMGEAVECLRLFVAFNCSFFVHDYGGAGALRESMIVAAGMPLDRIFPVMYTGRQQAMIQHQSPGLQQPRHYWTMVKSRSLQIMAYAIKYGFIRFFKYDHVSAEEPGLLEDFLALLENKIPTASGSDVYTIIKHPRHPDDLAQAVNIGACMIWHITDSWPDFARHMLDRME